MNTRTQRVLLVEDDPIVRSLVRQELEEPRWCVVEAEDAAQARQSLARQPSFDCILLDRGLPDCDGLALLKDLKSLSAVRDVPVVLQTGRSDVASISEGMAAGAYYYLTKPFQPALLAAVVQAAIEAAREVASARKDLLSASNALHMLAQGRFELRTISEARELALALAPLCPKPEGALLVLQELLINAIEHGNLAIDYARKRDLLLDGQLHEEIDRRMADPVFAARVARVELRRGPGEIAVTIADEGEGFDWNEFLEFSPDRMFDPNGRGIMIARGSGVHSLEYQGRGNVVTARWRTGPAA